MAQGKTCCFYANQSEVIRKNLSRLEKTKKEIAFIGVSIALKGHHKHSNSYKGKHATEVSSQFRGLVHLIHSGWQR